MSFTRGSAIIGDLVFYLYLVWAAYQDCREKLVWRGTHLMGLAAVGIYCLPVIREAVVALSESGGTTEACSVVTALLSVVRDERGMYGFWNVWVALFGAALGEAGIYDLWNTWVARVAVLVPCLICEGIYRRFSLYGLADSLVFLNCTLYFWVQADAFSSFFLFWWLKAFSGLLFLAAQLFYCRRLRWRLDEPAAYIPCILGAFALTNIVIKGYNV